MRAVADPAASQDHLPIYEDRTRGVQVKGLTECYVSSAAEVHEALQTGQATRVVSSTRMNAESSRSHSIFMMTIQQRNTETGASKSGNLYLVDLAGSEKVGKTGAKGQTLEEAKKINRSLTTLGMVINALTDGSSHVPYRDSKLTRILQESLGGNSRTTLIVNCSPVAYNAEETLSTLRFGVRAKSIQNNARVNVELSPAELRGLLRKATAQASAYKQYATRLEAELGAWRSGQTVPPAKRVALLSEGGTLPKGSGQDADVHVAEVADAHAQEQQRLRQQLRAVEAELDVARSKLGTVTAEAQDLREQNAVWEEQVKAAASAAAVAASVAAGPASATTTREARVQAMLEELAGQRAPIDPLLALIDVLSTAAQTPDAPMPLSREQVQTLEEGIVQTQVALSEEAQAARIAAQENLVLQQQKTALADRNAALEQRYDLTSSEALHLEQLLAIRSEETAGMARSLEDLRASHEEQRRALELLSASLIRGDAQGPSPEAVQRLLDASWQMEKTRELVTLRLREYERLKEQLMQGLRERSERIVEMEMEVEQMQDHYRLLLQRLGLRVQQRQMGVLERRLEQLGHVQRRLVDQNSSLKEDVALAERRLAARRVSGGSTSSLDDDVRSDDGGARRDAPARIAKPVRGGGGGGGGGGAQPPPAPARWFFSR